MPELGHFQSLLQLSVALNVTFTIVISIFGNSVSREKLIIQNLLNQARDARDEAVQKAGIEDELKKQSLAICSGCYRLKRKLEKSIDWVDRLAFERLRPFAIMGALVCFAFLIVCSYLPNLPLAGSVFSGVVLLVAIGSLLPFLGFVAWSAYYSKTQSNEARDERVRLDEELTKLMDRLNQPIATAGTT